jgi:hypothetical protein
LKICEIPLNGFDQAKAKHFQVVRDCRKRIMEVVEQPALFLISQACADGIADTGRPNLPA